MNQQLYTQLKLIFDNYTFNDKSNFYHLFRYAKKAGLKGLSFHQFTTHAKNMGVLSDVMRDGDIVKRVLLYAPKSDIYLKKVFPTIVDCPICKGTGVVNKKV